MTSTSTSAAGQVPSWAVTDEQLASWGFPVEVTEKIVGSKTVVRPGMTRQQAIHEAWGAGLVRIASENRDGSWAEAHGKARPALDAEVFAWAGKSHLLLSA